MFAIACCMSAAHLAPVHDTSQHNRQHNSHFAIPKASLIFSLCPPVLLLVTTTLTAQQSAQ